MPRHPLQDNSTVMKSLKLFAAALKREVGAGPQAPAWVRELDERVSDAEATAAAQAKHVLSIEAYETAVAHAAAQARDTPPDLKARVKEKNEA